MNWDYVGFFAAFCTTIAFLPQVSRIIKLSSTRDLSLSMYLLSFLGIFLWTIYGFVLKSKPIMFSNIITLMFIALVVYFIVRDRYFKS